MAFGAGIVTLSLFLVAAFHARDIAIAYHVDVLRRDTRMMPAWLNAPDGSLKREGLREFVRTPAGQRALRKRIVDAVIGLAVEVDAGFLIEALGKGKFLQFGLFELGKQRLLLIDGPQTLYRYLPPESEILAWGDLLESLGSGDFELAEHPGVSLTVWAYREGSGRGPVVVEGSLTRRS